MSTIIKAEHIDREKLYTDLWYRFQYLAKFVGFGPDDIAALKQAAPLVAPVVPSIVDAVYVKLFSFDITKEVFLNRNEGFRGNLASNLDSLDLNNDQIKFRKDFLGKYLVKLVTGDYDERFVRYLDWVGKIHTSTPEKKSKINVDYMHCGALFGYVHGHLVGLIDGHPDLQANQKVRTAVLAAFSKLLWIQNDLFARYYVKDGEEYRPYSKQRTAETTGLSFKNPTMAWAVAGLAAAVATVTVLSSNNRHH